MEVKSGNVTITLENNVNYYELACENDTAPFMTKIHKSIVMEEWNMALCPTLYKSAKAHIFVLQNKIACDIDNKRWYRMNRQWQTHDLDDDSFAAIVRHLLIPDEYIHEITDVLKIDSLKNATLRDITHQWNRIPVSIDMSKWRYMRTIDVIAKEEAWKLASDVIHPDGILQMSPKSAAFAIRNFYGRNTEYVNSEFKRHMVQKKIILPIQAPLLLQYNPVCMSSTQQSDKAGKVAEEPVGLIKDGKGYVIGEPLYSVSITGAQCPFPNRMKPTREVVLKAISQSMLLENEAPPMVTNELTQ